MKGAERFCIPSSAPGTLHIWLSGVRGGIEQRWTQYAASLLAFSAVCFVFTYAIQRLQGILPLNPAGFRNKAG